MPFLKFTITNLPQVLNGIDGIIRDFPNVKRDIHEQATKVFHKDAVDNVHEITGKTKRSLRIAEATEKQGVVEGKFGARWETRRPGNKPPPTKGRGTGPHNFSKHAFEITVQKLPDIIKRAVMNVLIRHRTR